VCLRRIRFPPSPPIFPVSAMGKRIFLCLAVVALLASLDWGKREASRAFAEGDNATAAKDAVEWLDKSAKAAAQITDPEGRAQAFAELAALQARAGKGDDAAQSISKALAAARKTEEGSERDITLVKIVQAQIAAKLLDDAAKTALDIADVGVGHYTRGLVAQAYAKAGKFAECIDMAQKVDDVVTMVQIAISVLDAGSADNAVKILTAAAKTARAMEDDTELYKAGALAAVGKGMALAGKLDEARKLFAEARKFVEERPDAGEGQDHPVFFVYGADPSLVRVETVKALAEAGKYTEAVSLAEEFDKWIKGPALAEITGCQVKAGLLADALRTAGKLGPEDPQTRINAFRDIALAAVKAGNAPVAEGAFSEAVAATANMPKGRETGFALLALAEAEAKAGMAQQAIATAKRIREQEDAELLPDSALQLVVRGLAESGKIADASAAVKEIESRAMKDVALQDVARAQAKGGGFAEAMMTVSDIESDIWRAYALVAVAEGSVAAGKKDDASLAFKGALGVAAKVPDNDYLLRYIAEAQFKAGMREEANKTLAVHLEVVRKNANMAGRAEALLNAAGVQAKAGDAAGAAKTFAEARDALKDVTDIGRRNDLYLQIAAKEQNGGLDPKKTLADAVASLKDEKDPSIPDCLSRIALAQAQAGRLAEALDVVKMINPEQVKMALVRVLDAATSIEDKPDLVNALTQALAMVRKMEDGLTTAYLLALIAEQYAEAGRGDKTAELLPQALAMADAAQTNPRGEVRYLDPERGDPANTIWEMQLCAVAVLAEKGNFKEAMGLARMAQQFQRTPEYDLIAARAVAAGKIAEVFGLMKDEPPYDRAQFCMFAARAIVEPKNPLPQYRFRNGHILQQEAIVPQPAK